MVPSKGVEEALTRFLRIKVAFYSTYSVLFPFGSFLGSS